MLSSGTKCYHLTGKDKDDKDRAKDKEGKGLGKRQARIGENKDIAKDKH